MPTVCVCLLVRLSTCENLARRLGLYMCRYLLRDLVSRQASNLTVWRALNTALSRDGWKVVALIRLAPVIPYNLSNYAFGATQV